MLSTLPLQCEVRILPEQEDGSHERSCLTPCSSKIVAHSCGRQSGRTSLGEGVKDILHCPEHDMRELAKPSQVPKGKIE